MLGCFKCQTSGRKIVEDYANQFVRRAITTYEKEWAEAKIVDGKIISLERIVSFDKLLSSFKPTFRIITKDGYVQSIKEQYAP